MNEKLPCIDCISLPMCKAKKENSKNIEKLLLSVNEFLFQHSQLSQYIYSCNLLEDYLTYISSTEKHNIKNEIMVIKFRVERVKIAYDYLFKGVNNEKSISM